MQRIVVKGVSEVRGPLIVLEGLTNIQLGEYVVVHLPEGSTRTGRVLAIEEDKVIILIYQGTYDLEKDAVETEFFGRTMKIFVSEHMIGRIFDSVGKPLDDLPPIYSDYFMDINGAPINPVGRVYPRNFIELGISAIDVMNTIVRGQKIPIFTGAGLPNNELIGQIIKQAHIIEEGEKEKFAIVVAFMGITHDDYLYFQRMFQETGAINKVVMFVNFASDSSAERLITPRLALTTAEYLAYEKDYHVLAVLSDITNYCQALREVAISLGTTPSRKGYPGYMYSDLASLYERSGVVSRSKGSITLLANVTMPNDDITHPIPDLTGYITEGQIILSRSLYNRGIYPPIDVLSSLSRLMKDGIGKGATREDHSALSNQLYAAYATGLDKRQLAEVIGRKELSSLDQLYLDFADKFEAMFINQGDTHRSIFESLDLGWELLKMLPRYELTAIPEEMLERYLPQGDEET